MSRLWPVPIPKLKYMNLINRSLMILGLSAVATAMAGDSKTETIKKFAAADPTISKDLKATDDKAWLADCPKPQVIRLFELPDPGVENCLLIYRARLKSQGLEGQAYLEMWCRFPGKGEFFSRGLQNTLSGSNDWASYETPFFLKKGEKPDLLKLNLVVKGTGKVWIKDVEILKAPLPKGK
jgi:hypothetical protein